MNTTAAEEHLLALFRQCSPMQKMLITDAMEEMLAAPGQIDLLSEGTRYDFVQDDEPALTQNAAGAENMGKVLPFRRY